MRRASGAAMAARSVNAAAAMTISEAASASAVAEAIKIAAAMLVAAMPSTPKIATPAPNGRRTPKPSAGLVGDPRFSSDSNDRPDRLGSDD